MKNKIFILTLFVMLLMPAVAKAYSCSEPCTGSILSSGRLSCQIWHKINCRHELPPSSDDDNDSVPNSDDNCPFNANGNCSLDQVRCDADGDGETTNEELGVGNQIDSDADGVGDACTDTDMDGAPNYLDNCAEVSNSDQSDADDDGFGDECEVDYDGDDSPDDVDNCPLMQNPTQADSDRDSKGDACDNCKTVSNLDQADANGNRVGDACEVDTDHDGIPDSSDNCRVIANPDQSNSDGDTVGDACEQNLGGSVPPPMMPQAGFGGQRQGCTFVGGAEPGSMLTILGMLSALIAIRRKLKNIH